MHEHFLSFIWQLQLINLGLSSIALSNYIHLDLAYYSQSTPLSLVGLTIRNIKNINCRSDWRDQGRIERGTPTPGHLCKVLIFTVKYAKF